jgi:CheY-like chemotaxis protein
VTGLEGCRVLVVEDEALIALDIVAMLEDLGVHVYGPASTLTAALEAAEGAVLDAALLDVNLARQEVWPVADVLRRRCIPIIFMTGYAGFKFPSPFNECPRLEKPVVSQHLAGELGRLLRRRQE